VDNAAQPLRMPRLSRSCCWRRSASPIRKVMHVPFHPSLSSCEAMPAN